MDIDTDSETLMAVADYWSSQPSDKARWSAKVMFRLITEISCLRKLLLETETILSTQKRSFESIIATRKDINDMLKKIEKNVW